MSKLWELHPDNPQPRLISQIVEALHNNEVLVVPTDSCYALITELGNREGYKRIRQIRQLPEDHNFTIACKDLSNIARYSDVDNRCYRILKHNTPSPTTWLLKATKEVPKLLWHPRKKTIGIRVPSNVLLHTVLEQLESPVITTSLIPADGQEPLCDPDEIRAQFAKQVDGIAIDTWGLMEPTTMVDLIGDTPEIVRQGAFSPKL